MYTKSLQCGVVTGHSIALVISLAELHWKFCTGQARGRGRASRQFETVHVTAAHLF